MKIDNIRVDGHIGTWEVIEEVERQNKVIYLLEHEEYGGLAPCVVINSELQLIIDNCHNAFMDYDEIVEEAEYISSEAERYKYLKDNFKSEKHIMHLMNVLNKTTENIGM